MSVLWSFKTVSDMNREAPTTSGSFFEIVAEGLLYPYPEAAKTGMLAPRNIDRVL